MVEDKWTEIIEDLWKHLPHFQDVEELYDDHCLKFDCVTLQFGHGEESDSDSETWVHQNTSDMEDSYEEVTKKEECELTKFLTRSYRILLFVCGEKVLRLQVFPSFPEKYSQLRR